MHTRPLATRFFFPALVTAFAVAVSGCSKPEPPTLTPKGASVIGVSLAGVNVRLTMEAFNPNRIELSARSVTGNVTLDGKVPLGTVTIPSPVLLPPNARTTLDVPLDAKWNDVGAIATLAATNAPVTYAVDGTVNIGGDRLNVDVPFHMTGTIAHEDIVKATVRSLPALPGLPNLKLQ